MASLGLYPVNPASGRYAVTTSLFRKANIHLADGKTFVITTENGDRERIYIGRMLLNGKTFRGYEISYQDITDGGGLEVVCIK